MSKVFKNNPQQSKLILEELEERRLFSGGIEGLIASDLDSEAQAIYADADKAKTANANNETSASVAEQQSQEIVFIDAGVDNYQQLVDDIHNNADSSRNIEVVVLDRDKDGIEEISEFLSHRENLDAIHIISHGSDGSVELGNTSLNADTLEQNNLKIALWANNFADTGDILIYGCSLAETEVGQSLIADLGALTLTDVAASDDLTGAAALGGDWELEYSAGSIEAQMAISIAGQQQWAGVLTNFTVDTLLDTNDVTPGNGVAEDISGNTSIRAAIEEANALAGADTITIGAGTFTLSGGQLVISSDVTITGAGPGLTIIDGASIDRVFEIVNNATVTLEGMTITGGGNVVSGGGISVSTGNTLTLVNAVLTGNDASQGGAIYNNRNLIMDQVSVISNTAGIGGGLFNSNTATITNSLFYDNTASNDGGGIWVDGNGTSLTLTNTTLSGNTADTGGGLFSGSLATLTNVTITDNTATTNGGGIAEGTGTVTTELLNTIVAGNTSPTGSDIDGSIDSLGYNIIGDTTDSSGWIASDQQNVDPLLGALADNGGPTLSHALLAGSTAIDGGTNTGAPTTDQRGYIETDATMDIGAYQYGAVAPSISVGLQVHHTYDVDASDASGNNRDGILSDNAAVDTNSGTNRIGDGKLILDGANDYVNLNTHAAGMAGYTEGAIGAWINTSAGTQQTIFSLGDTAGSSFARLYLQSDGSLRWTVSEAGSTTVDVTSNAAFNDGNWHHVAVTVGSSGNSLWVDGVELTVAAATYSNGSAASTNFFDDLSGVAQAEVGAYELSGTMYDEFSGLIDDFRIYDRTLTAGDIGELQNPWVYGTPGDDVIAATAGNDQIDALGGNDTIDYSGAAGPVTVDLTSTAAQNTGGSGIDTLLGFERVIGSSGNDSFQFGNPANGAAYQVDGNTGSNTIDLSGYASSAVTFGNGTMTVDMGGGQSFTIDYVNIDTIDFLDVSANVLTNDIALTNWSGDAIFIDADETFRLSLTGGGTMDWGFVRGTDTLTVTGTTGTDASSALVIDDLNGTDLSIDQITVSADIGAITSDADIGTIAFANDVAVVTTVQADVGTLDITGDVASDLTVQGDVGPMSMAKILGGATLHVTGSVGPVTLTSDISGTLQVDGNMTSLTMNKMQPTGVVTVGGDVTSIDTFDVSGPISITGNLGSWTMGKTQSDVTITIGGNVGTIGSGDELNADIIIGGDLDSANFNSINSAATVTANQVVGTLVFDVGGTDYGGTYATPVIYVFDGSNQTPSTTLANDAPTFIDGAVGNWNFDEGSGDSVAEGAIGISTATLGSTTGADANDPTWTSGVFGQALQFDGVDDYVEIADAPGIDISGPEFSASLWVKPDRGPGTEDMFFMKGDRQGTGNVNYYLSWKDSGKMTWAFKSDGGFEYIDIDVTLPTVDEWNHVAVVFDRPTVSIYINGIEYTGSVGTGGTSMDKDLVANDDPLWIGAGRSGGSIVTPGNYSAPFSGAIDELALFDRALTAAEIEAIRTSAPPVVTASAFNIDENSANNTVVGTVAANDPDVGDTLSYAITAGNNSGAFTIDNNGVITVANSAALDFETNPVFTLTVEATDDGSPNLSDSTSVTITLNNLNDDPIARGDRVGLSFDGVDDYVQIGADPNLEMTDHVTMEAWIKPALGGSGSQIIINKEGEYEVAMEGDTGEIKWGFNNTDPGWAWHNTGHFVTANEWAHVAVSYDSGVVKTYVNGNLIDTYNGSGSIDDDGPYPDLDDLRIGGRQNTFAEFFEGEISEARVWNVTRSDTEIQTAMDQQLTGAETGLVGNWRLDEGAGTVVQDQSSLNNNGTLGNGVTDAEPAWSGLVTDKNTTLIISEAAHILANDTDPDGDPLSITGFTQPANGTLVDNGNGTWTYTPDLNFSGVDTFTYTISDGNGGIDTADISITVNPVNDAPTGTTLVVAAVEETATAIDISSNVADVDGSVDLTTTLVTSGPSNGTLTNNNDGTFSYTGDLNFVGADSFTYTVEDNDGQVSSNITVTINVSDVNDAPTGTTLVVAAVEETATAIDISSNVTDVDGTVDLTTTLVTSGPGNGSLTNNGDGTFSYTGDLNFVGADSFTYTVEDNDGQVSSNITVTINVSDVNDAPTAVADAFVVNEDTPTNLDPLANDSDPENDTLTLLGFERVVASYDAGTSGSAVDPASVAGGSWFIEDTEDADAASGNLQSSGVSPDGATGQNAWNIVDGSDAFGENLWYSATLSPADAALAGTDGWSLSAEIRLVDDFDDTRTTFIRYGDGTTRFVAYFDLDSNNDLTVELIDDGGNQLITLTDDGSGSVDYHHYEIVYDPNTSTAMFLFDGVRVDGGGWSGEASTNEGVRWGMGSGSGQASANYHSIDMKVFDQSITTANGATVTNNGDGTVNYDPAQNFTGADSFSYTIRDSEGHLDTATVNVTVDAVNDDPVITSDGSGAVAAINVAENTTVVTTVTANDVDLDTPTFSITGGADQGLFTILPTGELSFLVAPDFEGPGDNSYVVEITAADGNGGFDVQTITVTVTDVNDGVIRVTPLSLAPLGGETLVNTGTTDNQSITSGVSQALATDANGNYVIVWSSNLQDGAGWGIYAQLFNADGTAQGSEIPINSTTADSQLSASVAMDAAGNFVVTWQSNLQDGDGYGIFARAFNAAGVAQGGEIPVNTYTTGYQGAPGIAMAANGDFVIQWASSVQDPDGSYGIYAQRFNAAGTVQGGEFRVNTYIPGYQQVSSISMDDAGNFVVTWGSQGQDGSSYGVFGQIFNADGSPRGPEFQANTTTQYSQLYNDVAMLPDGRFVVAYQSANADTSTDLFIQAFNADGSKHGVEIQVNAVSDMDYFPIPSISADASGNFTVVWNNSNDGALSGVFMRSYDWDGNALSGEVQVNTTTAGEQLYPEIVAQPGGGLIVAWSGNGTGDADGVFTQRYGLSTDEDGNSTTFQLVLEHAPTADVIIPVSVSDGSEGTVSIGSVTFTSANWNTPQIVTVTGVQDFILDDDQTFTVNIGPATSTDLNFNGLDPADLIVTNHETNTPPVITSDGGGATVSINVAENTTAVTTVTATDADLDTPTFTITGGADQGLFSIDLNSGLLTFDTPPNFEGPGDNSYTVEVTAADGFGGIDVQTINVSVTNVNEAPVANADSANLVFDGDDIVQVADHASLQMSNNLTMEAWFNYSSSGTGSQLILNKEGEYELGVIADTGEIQFAITQSDNTWSWHRTGVFVNPDEWAHVAVTYDGTAGEAKTYINGELVDTYLQSGNIGDVYTAYDDLFIGGRENDADERFNGQIDEVRIWDTTRSQTDIQNNYSDKLTGAEPGLAGYWRLNEADGTLVADMSANNNDGTLGGAEGAASTPTYDGYFTDQNTTLVIAAVDGVLANDFDADGDSLAVTNLDTTGMLGTLNLNAADGSFSYDPNGAFDYLDAGEIAYETFTYTANDSSLDSNVVSVTITVVGTEDAAVVGGTVTGAVSEDGTLTSSDNLTITDADTSDNPVTFNDVAATLGDSGYGDFEITGNAWTYTLNNAHPALQALDVGETLTDTHSFTATDGSTQQVTITINGAEDAPVFDSTAIIVATEDVAYSYTITTSDVDIENVTITAPTLPAWLTFVDNGNGTATLSGTPGNAEVGNHNVVLNVSDGTLNSNQNFTITVSNTNDPAVIGGTDTGAVQEDVAVVANNISTSGTLTITDPDTGESSFQAATITGTYGDLVMQTNGNWTYTADNTQAAIQQLDVSEFITDTLTVTSFDGTTHNVVITINGSEDAAVISGTTTGSVTEDGTLTSSGALTITDTDTSDTPSFADVTSTGGDNGYGNFVMTAGTWTYTLDNNAAAVQALDVGETLTDTHTFTATDGSTQVVTVTINGAEDTPVFDSTAITAATEDLAYSYTITTSDVDVENVTITAPTLPAWLTFVDNGNGTATLSGTPTNAEVGNHNVVLNVSDGTLSSNQNFTIIVANTNDPAVIGGADTGAVQEDVGVVANNISTSGTLTIADPDSGESSFLAATINGTYGDLTIDSAGTWTYTSDNTQAAIQQLDALESITDTLTVTSFDGTTHNVVITINGAEDAAVISGTTTGSVTEDGTLTSSGALTITDTDTSDTPGFADVGATAGDNGYGSFVMASGTWTYTLDNNDPAVQALDVSETLTDTHTFTATDGSTQVVTVTINGAEDAPAFDSTAVTAATEDVAYSYTITTSDVDIETVTITAPTLPGWLTFVDNGNGTATLSGTPGNAEVGNHNVVLNVSDGTLSSNQNFTVVVSNTNDPAVIAGTDTGAVQEDVAVVANNISTTGTLTITDPDTGESTFQAGTAVGAYGSLTIDTAGNWTYTADNTQAAIQQLDISESLTDTLTVTSFDGTTHNVVITINGSEDAAVISGTITGSVTEDGTLTSSGTLTISDTDDSDTPAFADVTSTAGDNAYGNFVMTAGTWTYTLDNSNPAVQALDVTETLTDTHTFTATDGITQVVTVTINGAEDAPVFDSTAIIVATEDVAYSYTITTSDVDIETVTITAPTLPAWLTFVDNGDGTATLSGTPGNAEVGSHNVVLNVSDGTLNSNQNFTIVVGNTNDAAVIGGADTGAVQEDVAVVTNNISTSGTLTITDPDVGESSFQAATITGTYGDLVMQTNGNWTYTADNTQAAIQQLDVSEFITDTLTVTSFDGTTHNVVITINGSDDAAVITGTTTGSVTEDGTLTSSGALTITDTDTSDTPSFADVGVTAGDNAYGTFVMTSGTWTYTLDNSNPAVQALDVTETLTDTYTFTATDGITQVVTVTINGAEDAPVFDSTAIIVATEDVAYSYTITTSDVDVENVTITAPTLPTWLSFVDNGNGTATLSGTPTNAEVGSHNVVLNVSDGTLSSNQNFTIVVSNTNDAAVIGGADTGAVQEDVAVVANNISTSGSLTIVDPDTGESSFQAATINGTYGDLVMQTNGNWTYTADNTQAVIQQLDVLESITDTLTVTSFDGTTHNVVITINGSEDAAVISGTTTGTVTEDGTLTSSGTLSISDTDTSDTPSFADVGVTAGDNAYGTFVMTAVTWTYTLDNSNPAVQALDVTETLTDTHTFTATDGSTQLVTVTINGAEDAPVFDSTAVTAATEDVAYSYTVTTSDVDVENVTITAPTLPTWLSFVDNGDGTATLSGTPTNAEVGSHNVVLNVSDGTLSSNQNFTIVVSNTNDAAVIGGADTGSVQENVAVVANNISTSGTLTIVDPDTGESSFQAATINGTYGDLVMQTNGNWTYTADNTQAVIQQLDVLESITDTLTVTSFDGTTHNVVITINGSEDTAVISGTISGSVTEDGTLTSSGTLTITDTDTSDTPSFADVGATAGDNGYGSFVMTSGTWTYTLNNAHPAVQALDVTETLSDTHTFTATDGSTQVVTITINGAEDTPVFDSTAITAATEDVAYSYTITTSDVDVENVAITAPTLPGWLSFVDNGDGTATLSGTPGNAEVGNHNVVLNVSDGTLSSNQNFTIVVANANDPAVIGGADTGAVTEDVGVLGGMISTTGSLTIADPDSGESSFQPTTITGSYGDLTIDTAGNWIYSATNNQAAIQALDAGQSMTDTLTVSAFDGTTHDVVITINGSEDGSVVGGTAVGAVVEDGTLIVSDTLTITDVDSSDNPISFSDVTPTLGVNGYGSFEMSGNIWTYTLNNSHAAVQALDVGETLTDLFTFSASDGSTQVITITVNGAEDTPLFDSSAVIAATEDVVYSYTVTTRDADVEAVTITAPTLPAWLTFVDNGDGTATLGGTPTNAEVGSHNVVLSVSDGSLSSNQSFTIIVANTDDAPVIGGVDSGQVSEDEAVSGGKIATSGALTIADPDAGESSFVGSTINGALGALTIDTAGNWRYSADNGNPEIQALQSGESISETLTVTTADGSTHNVVITIHGAAEASVTPPPPVEPPTIEPPLEEEPPPVEEETVDDGTGQGSIVDDIVRAPQDVTPPPVQEVVDNSGYLQQEQAEADKARYRDQKDKPAVKIMELPQAQAIQQQAIQQQNLSLDELSLQVSDDETLNEKYELELLSRIDSMHSGMDDDVAQTSADDVEVQIVMGSTASLTAGIVSWVLRGGSLLASFMSTVPLLNRFDPLPILKSKEEKEDLEEDSDDDDSDTKFKKHQQRVDKLFSAKDNAREQNGYMND